MQNLSDKKHDLISIKSYLQQKLQPCIKALISSLIPYSNFKSIQDLFSSVLFHQFLISILSQQTKNGVVDIDLPEDNDPHQTYNQMNIKNFKKINQIIKAVFVFINKQSPNQIKNSQIEELINNRDMRILKNFLQNLFQIMVQNQAIFQVFQQLKLSQDSYRQMAGFIRNQLPVFIEDYHNNQLHKQNNYSFRNKQQVVKYQQESNMMRINELQNELQVKQEQLMTVRQQKRIIQDQFNELRRQIKFKEQQLQNYKKRIESYVEINQLLNQKDQQINKLTLTIQQIQLKSRRKQSEIQDQIVRLKDKIKKMESHDTQITIKFDKQKDQLQALAHKKLQSQNSMKIVINNLKQTNQKLKSMIKDLNDQVVQANFIKQKKQKQIENLIRELQRDSKIRNNQIDSSPRSYLREDLVEGIQPIRGNYSKLTDQINFDLQKSQMQEDLAILSGRALNGSSNRLVELLQQNDQLKKQIARFHSSNNYIDAKCYKQVEDELNKTKKKCDILRKRNDQIDNQRKQEIDIMIGAIEQCFNFNCNLVTAASKK